MRKIKFRVWNTEEKKWVKPQVSFWPTDSSDNYKEMYLEPEGKEDLAGMHTDNFHLILLQYTGLKDKNGKEIYEGDIVKTGSGATGVVEWNEDIDTDRYWWIASGFSIYIEEATGTLDMEEMEVIGNIYENKELINGR